MKIERKTAFAPRTNALGQQIATLRGPCVGCEGCTGLCQELIEAIVLPELLLSRKPA